MTRINALVARGFKSFGKRTELIFGQGFNCVLGPNGSGKSNVVDSICFVLGKGSAKGLRADKSANLIYNGGKLKEPATFGEVSIAFDNTNHEFPYDAHEVMLTRVIKQNGQSTYKINSQRSTRQQVLDLLSLVNVDPDGYNIVLQGDIARIVEMSPFERRQLVEDIAGIGVYEEKKNKALNELQKVEERVNEAEIILNERKTYLKELKKERDHALKYKELDEKINRNKATYLNLQIEDKTREKDACEKEIASYKTIIDEKQGKITALKQQILEKKQEIQNITKEVEEKGEKQQVALLKSIEQLRVDIATNKTKITSHEHEIQRLQTRKTQLESSLKEIDIKLKELATEKNDIEKRKLQLAKEMLQLDARIAQFKKKNNMENLEMVDHQIEDVDKEAEHKQKEIQTLREEQQTALREKDKITYQLQTLDEKINKVLELEKEHKKELDKIKQKREEFKKVTLDLNKSLHESSSLNAQYAHAKENGGMLREEVASLRTRAASTRESSKSSIAIKAILEQQGKLGEIYGTVADLGEVPSPYSLALEIAAGPKLRSIVVDTDKTAAECIKYLKKNQLGVATFLPLNKIKGGPTPDVKPYLKTQGVHGLASDLIEYAPKFKSVFSYVFAGTLVVDTIDVARRIGIGNIKMVTLEGDLVEVSGAMHGGYRERKSSIGFQEKEVSGSLKEKEKQLADTEKLIERLAEKLKENDEQITRMRQLKATLEGEIIKDEKALHLESTDLDASREVKKSLLKQQTDFDKQLEQVQQKLAAVNKELVVLKTKKQELRDMISQLRNPTILAELNTFEQKNAQCKEELAGLENSLKNIEMQRINILEPERENILKIIRQHDKEEHAFSDEIRTLKDLIAQQTKDLAEKEKLQKQFQGEFKDLFKKRDDLNTHIQKLENSIIALEEVARKNEQKMNTYAIDMARIMTELNMFQQEFSKYQGLELFKSKSIDELKREISEFEKMVQNLGNVNLKALEMYDTIEREYNALIEKKDKLLKEKEDVIGMMHEIETKKKDLFMKMFDVINAQFQSMFKNLSTKGDAFLELENPEHPLKEDNGIRIKVRVTGKKFLDIRSLSGGEKTLTALSFIFAIQEHKPASFYVLDEVDAALDKRNSERLAVLLKQYSLKAQYVVISHNDAVISSADTLYGVTMDEDNTSRVVSLKV